MNTAPTRRLVDLSVPIDPEHWEPDPVRRTVIGHRAGADLLGRSAAYLKARNTIDRWCRLLRLRAGTSGVTHRDFPDEQGLSLMRYELTTHTGTHMDAPWHYGPLTADEKPAATISDIPLEWCLADGVLLDLTAGPCDEAVTAEEVHTELARIRYTIKPNDIVLLRTGGDNQIGEPGYFQQFRGVTRAATAALVEQGVRVIGIDSFGFDAPFLRMLDSYDRTRNPDDLWPAHLYGRERPYCQLERLTSLDRIGQAHGFQVACFPVHLAGADAAWARVVAIVPSTPAVTDTSDPADPKTGGSRDGDPPV